MKSIDATSGASTAQALVDESSVLLKDELASKDGDALRELLPHAKGVLFIPGVGDVSLFFSVGGGNALLMARTDKGWTGPIFLSKAMVGWGFQAGVTKQSGLLLFMHEDDVRYVVETGGVLQAQARLVVMDTDMQFNETPEFYQSGDVYFFGNRAGLYAGFAFDTGGFSNRTGLNEAFTGVKGGGPRNILFDRQVQPLGADRLRHLLDEAGAPAQKEKDEAETSS